MNTFVLNHNGTIINLTPVHREDVEDTRIYSFESDHPDYMKVDIAVPSDKDPIDIDVDMRD